MWSENDTRDENYRVAYATGPSPTGPWTKRGVILEKDLALGIKGTGHHSVVQVPGTDDWYIAYHRFAMTPGPAVTAPTAKPPSTGWSSRPTGPSRRWSRPWSRSGRCGPSPRSHKG